MILQHPILAYFYIWNCKNYFLQHRFLLSPTWDRGGDKPAINRTARWKILLGIESRINYVRSKGVNFFFKPVIVALLFGAAIRCLVEARHPHKETSTANNNVQGSEETRLVVNNLKMPICK